MICSVYNRLNLRSILAPYIQLISAEQWGIYLDLTSWSEVDLNLGDISNANNYSRGDRVAQVASTELREKRAADETLRNTNTSEMGRDRWAKRDGEEVRKKVLSMETAKDEHFKKVVMVKIGKSCQVINWNKAKSAVDLIKRRWMIDELGTLIVQMLDWTELGCI